jgi:hypothetical protein
MSNNPKNHTMKTTIRLLLATFAFGFLAIIQVGAADKAATETARFEATIAKFQNAGIVTADDADYFRKNVAPNGHNLRCDVDRFVKIVNGAVKARGGKPANLDETIAYMVEHKMVGDPAALKKNLTQKAVSGSYAFAVIMRLGNYIK